MLVRIATQVLDEYGGSEVVDEFVSIHPYDDVREAYRIYRRLWIAPPDSGHEAVVDPTETTK